ncbi:MAG: tRNA pseudouridine(38-40) synthase TruA [Candidatus Methanoplasma sp.]|jgi:tRNA pseudouridine38-40 synthase|nr:tRNA pseudouridine(38-40) synthase TruA [Candidatus Methanoplasma sp.]
MIRTAVKIAYLGNDFSGSQIQPGFRTVEGDVLSDLRTICRISDEELDLRLASRTDRGVNALGNVAVFNTPLEDLEILLRALNAVSKGIFYRSSAVVDPSFNPRYADRRRYRYVLPTAGVDIVAAKKCAALFIGEHDFRQFCRADGKQTCLTIDSIDVWSGDGTIVLDFTARYYLWNMIRRITAAVVSVGRGDSAISDVQGALEGNDVTFGLARPDALTLLDVEYDDLGFITPADDLFDGRVQEELFRDKLRSSFFASL